jgi:hypothetical protein
MNVNNRRQNWALTTAEGFCSLIAAYTHEQLNGLLAGLRYAAELSDALAAIINETEDD